MTRGSKQGAARTGAAMAAVVLMLFGTAACGGGKSSAAVGKLAAPPEPEEAATGFSGYFTSDATTCDTPDWSLQGAVSDKIWDHYTCHDTMTAQEISHHCHRDGGGGSGGAHAKPPVTVSTNPLAKRYSDMGWASTTICPGLKSFAEGGTYDVTVTKVSGGWIATSFTITSGPTAVWSCPGPASSRPPYTGCLLHIDWKTGSLDKTTTPAPY